MSTTYYLFSVHSVYSVASVPEGDYYIKHSPMPLLRLPQGLTPLSNPRHPLVGMGADSPPAPLYKRGGVDTLSTKNASRRRFCSLPHREGGGRVRWITGSMLCMQRSTPPYSLELCSVSSKDMLCMKQRKPRSERKPHSDSPPLGLPSGGGLGRGHFFRFFPLWRLSFGTKP